MQFDAYQRIFGNLQGYANRICLYILGEPLLNPDVFKIISHTEQLGIPTIVSTNGMLIGEHLLRILDSGLSYIQVAIDGWSQKSHAAHRAGADLEQIVSSVSQLHKERERLGLRNPTITIQSLVNKLNQDQLGDIEAFARIRADHFTLKKMMLGRTEKAVKRNRQVFEPDDARYQRTGCAASFYRDMPICPQLLQINVLVNGSVVPCCFDFDGTHVWGNLLDQPLSDILTGRPRKEFMLDFFRKRSQLCLRCDFVQDMQIGIF